MKGLLGDILRAVPAVKMVTHTTQEMMYHIGFRERRAGIEKCDF